MPRPQLELVDRDVQVVFTNGTLIGTLESVGDDGSLYLRQGRTPVWVPLSQVRYVTLAEEVVPPDEPDEPIS